jgi:hypothetical protein
VGFIKQSRQPSSKYIFNDMMHFGYDDLVVFRWALEAVYGDGMPERKHHQQLGSGRPRLTDTRNATKKANITYNGTDILKLERCSGLISEGQNSQDLSDFYHQLGILLGTVREDGLLIERTV